MPSELARARGARRARAELDLVVRSSERVVGIVGRVGGVRHAPGAEDGVVGRGGSSLEAHEVIGVGGAIVPRGARVAVDVCGV